MAALPPPVSRVFGGLRHRASLGKSNRQSVQVSADQTVFPFSLSLLVSIQFSMLARKKAVNGSMASEGRVDERRVKARATGP